MAASFGTVASRLGEIGMGYLAGTAEREAAARTERLQLLSQGLQLGASGVDLTKYLTPDLVSPDNQQFFQHFSTQGSQFTEPYRQRVQLAASQTKAQQDFELAKADREYQFRDLWNRRTNETTLAAAAIRAASSANDPLKISDQKRVEELADEEIGGMLISQFPFLLTGDVDNKGNATINPEYAPILAQVSQRVKASLRPEDYGSYPAMRAAIQREMQRQAPEIVGGKNHPDIPFGLGWAAKSPSVKFNQVTSDQRASAMFDMASRAITSKVNPNERALIRQKTLAEIERQFGSKARAEFDKKLPR